MGGTRMWIGDRPSIGEQANDQTKVVRCPTSILGQTERMDVGRTVNLLMADCSSSTNDSIAQNDPRPKITGIKDALSTFVVNSPESAYISVITFGETANVLCDIQARGQNPYGMLQQIQRISSNGLTAMCGAFRLAIEQCKKAPQGYLIRVYVLSDGLPTDGDAFSMADDLKRTYPNLQIHTIGFGYGENIDENLLRNIASRSSSGETFYYHVLDAVKLTGILKRQSRNLFK